MKNNKLLYIIITIIIFILFLKFIFDFSNFFIWFLIISTLLVWLLINIKSIFAFVIASIIVILNFILLTFALIPTYDEEVDVWSFYSQKWNYLSIEINDNIEDLEENNARIRIIWPGWKNETYNINEDKEWKEIRVRENYVVSFVSSSKDIDSIVNLHLRDWTILKIFPQTTIRLNEIFQNHSNLTESRTNISLESWNIWFTVVRTIVSDDWFNIETNNWALVIRWTSWFINHNQQDNETNIFSYNHIIEYISEEWKSKILWKNEAARIKDNIIKEIDINEFINDFWEDLYKRLNRFFQYDQEIIEEYKDELVWYIEENYWWVLDESERISKLSEWKLRFQSLYDEDAKSNLENYRKYSTMVWKSDISQFNDYLENAILVPVNENLERAKINFLELLSEENVEAARSYATNKFNEVLEMWEDIDTDNIKDIIESSDINIDSIIDRVNNFSF